MKNETRKDNFGLYKFYLRGENIGHMVIGLLSQAEEFAREYLDGVDDYLAHIDIFNSLGGACGYIETIYKELAEE